MMDSITCSWGWNVSVNGILPLFSSCDVCMLTAINLLGAMMTGLNNRSNFITFVDEIAHFLIQSAVAKDLHEWFVIGDYHEVFATLSKRHDGFSLNSCVPETGQCDSPSQGQQSETLEGNCKVADGGSNQYHAWTCHGGSRCASVCRRFLPAGR